MVKLEKGKERVMAPFLRIFAVFAASLVVGCQTTPTTTNEVLEFQRMGQVAFDDPNAPLLPVPTNLFIGSPLRPGTPQCERSVNNSWGDIAPGQRIYERSEVYCGFRRRNGRVATAFNVSRCTGGCGYLEGNLMNWSAVQLDQHYGARRAYDEYALQTYGTSLAWEEPHVYDADQATHGLLCVLYVGHLQTRRGSPVTSLHEGCSVPLQWGGEVRSLNMLLQYRTRELDNGTRENAHAFLRAIAELYGIGTEVAQQ